MGAISISIPTTSTVSSKSRWAGRIVSGIPALLLLFDATMKILNVPAVQQGMQQVGWPSNVTTPLGVVLFISVVIYLVPRTAFFGALLLTGYLGGAVATHVRIGDPLFSHILAPTYVATVLWAGLALRDPRVRKIVTG